MPGIAVLLTEGVGLRMLAFEMECIYSKPDISEPRIILDMFCDAAVVVKASMPTKTSFVEVR